MFANIGNLTSNVISSEKNLPLLLKPADFVVQSFSFKVCRKTNEIYIASFYNYFYQLQDSRIAEFTELFYDWLK